MDETTFQHASNTHEVIITAKKVSLEGFLTVPENAEAIVLFAHGSGSSRFSQRNRFVAESLNAAGFGTLLFDLLTSEEHVIDERTRHFRFDINLLSARLIDAIDWVKSQDEIRALTIGLFGSSTGAAAALRAAVQRPIQVSAVVSRGGRPDLTGESLTRVKAPTLLIVGGHDEEVIKLNEQAAKMLNTEYELQIIPGAGHLFEETGKLEQVAKIARDWFKKYLAHVS